MYAPVDNRSIEYTNAKGFRPTLASDIAQLRMTQSVDKRVMNTNDSYVGDSRYPALSAVMSDARQFTDYRPKCAANIAPASQYATKQWMIDNADNIIDKSRYRQAERLGATAAVAQVTGPGAAAVQQCTVDGCSIQNTGNFYGVGLERANTWSETDVPLFGTFSYAPVTARAAFNAPLITAKQEGGRNTIRSHIRK